MTTQQVQLPPKALEAKSPTFKFAYSFILSDFLARWILYGLWRFQLVKGWMFWIGQVVVITLVVFILVMTRNDKTKEKYKLPQQADVSPEATLLATILALAGVFLGAYIAFTIFSGYSLWIRIVSSLLTFVVYGFYVFAIYLSSVQTTSKEDETPVPIVLSVDEWVDENDLEIVRLETDKISLTQRVDTYTLESTLFGALSFSGFVTIIASDKDVLVGVRELITNLTEIARMILQFDFTNFGQPIAAMGTEMAVIAGIAVETLICSMFFLSVIVSRLRFNDVLKSIDYAVRIASSYNDKEEEVYNVVLQGHDEEKVQNRLQTLKHKISEAVYHAEESFREVRPIVNYMRVFRNLGLISFLLILITGALWVSPILAALFMGLAVLAFVYSALDTFIRTKRLEKKGIVQFFRKKAGLFPVPARKTNR